MHGYHGMVRSRFSRDPAPPAGRSAVRFRPWGALTASQVPQDVPLPPPITLRPSAAMLAAQRAILHSAPRALALGPGRSRQRATPRHIAARLAVRFALPSPQRTPAPSLSFSCAWALALLPPEAAQKIRGIQQSPAGRQEDLRSSASASARLRPGKGTEDAPETPRHLRPSGQELARHKAHGAHLASSSFAHPSFI